MAISNYTKREHFEAFENCPKDTIVAFAGSGCSYLPGIPTWTDFLEALDEATNAGVDVKSFMDRGEFYEAASAIYNALENPDDFYTEIETVINEKTKTDYIAMHHSIWSSFHRVLTTNYDHLFEHAIVAYNRPLIDKGLVPYTFQSQQLPELDIDTFDTTEKSLAYLHGRAGSQDLVLRREDYQKHYPSFYPGESPAPSNNLESFLERAIGRYSFVFIGFSLDDADFVRAFEQFIEKHREYIRNNPDTQSQVDNRNHFIFLLNDQLKDWLNALDIHSEGLSVDKLLDNKILKSFLNDRERLIFMPNLGRAIDKAGFSLEERAKIMTLKERLERNKKKLEQLQKLSVLDIRLQGTDFNAISRFLSETRPVAGSADQIDLQSI